MKKRTVRILFISILLFADMPVFSQSPVIENVTVINEQGHVQIEWDYSGGEDLVIYRDKLENNNISPIYNAANGIYSYIDTDAEAHLKPRAYRIKCETTTSLESDLVPTYHLTADYDSCLQQVELNWKYLESNILNYDWEPERFIINITEEGDLIKESVSATENSYIVQNIKENTNYQFAVEIKWRSQVETSFSNPVILFTQMPLSPDYINAVRASTEGESVNLRFQIAENSELETYKILKSSSLNGVYDTLETINTTNFDITSVDANADAENTVNFYKLVALNKCENIKDSSDIINNIVLELDNNDYVNTLTWNLFKEYKTEPVTYEIYRISNNTQVEMIRQFSNFYTYKDNVEDLQGEQYSGNFCYYIRAYEQQFSSDLYSQSNTVCVYLNPKVYVPEAFTPNDDGVNDLYQPVFTFLPLSYELKIYNRWGNLVFSTTDPSEAWDGKGANGGKLSAGAYIYYMKMQSEDNQTFEKNGSIIIIYP